MALATEVVMRKYLNVSAGVPIAVDIPTFQVADIQVFYGVNEAEAALLTDYTVALAEDFDTFTLTPTAALLSKITALMALDASELNQVFVRRELHYLTEATAPTCRYTEFVSREFERTAMRFQQQAERSSRAVTVSMNDAGVLTTLPAFTATPRVPAFSTAGVSFLAASAAEIDSVISGAMSEYAGLATVPHLPSVDALRTLSEPPGSVILLTGYHAAGDAGGGVFWYNPASAASDDGCFTIVHTLTGRRYERANPQIMRLPQTGAVDDGYVVDDDTMGGTNNTPYVQAWIDGALPGYELVLSGGDYFIGATATTGQNRMIAETTVSHDSTDFVCLAVFYKSNLKFTGNGARLLHNEGYVFFGSFCERVSWDNISFVMPKTRYETYFGWTGVTEPNAITLWYSLECSSHKCEVVGGYRGITFLRSQNSKLTQNDIYGCKYTSCDLRGAMSVPAGLKIHGVTAFNKDTYFSKPVQQSNDCGIIAENHVRCWGTVGIYVKGPGEIVDNLVGIPMNPDYSNITTAAAISSRSHAVKIHGNRVVIPFNAGVTWLETFINGVGAPTDDTVMIGIQVAVEDSNNLIEAVNNDVLDNTIEGAVVGIQIAENQGTKVMGNTIDYYSLCAIHLNAMSAGTSAESTVAAILAAANTIGRVSPNTVRQSTTYYQLGGIIIATTGLDTDKAGVIRLNDNVFRQELNNVVDAGTKASHQSRAVYMPVKDGGALDLGENLFNEDSGRISGTHNNGSGFTGRNVIGAPRDISATSYAIPSVDGRDNGVRRRMYRYTGAADGVFTYMQYSWLSQEITIINQSAYKLEIVPYDANYSLGGTQKITLDNRYASSGAQSRVHLVTRSGNSGNAYFDAAVLDMSASNGAAAWIGTPAAPTSVLVTADGQVVPVGSRPFIRFTSDSAVAADRTIVLAKPDPVPHRFVLELISTNPVQLVDGAAMSGGGVTRLGGANWEPSQYGLLDLFFDGTDCIKV